MYTATVTSTLSTLFTAALAAILQNIIHYVDMNEDILNPNKKKQVLP